MLSLFLLIFCILQQWFNDLSNEVGYFCMVRLGKYVHCRFVLLLFAANAVSGYRFTFNMYPILPGTQYCRYCATLSIITKDLINHTVVYVKPKWCPGQ